MIIEIVKAEPGILQKDIYSRFDPAQRKAIISILQALTKEKVLFREPYKNTFKLFLKPPILRGQSWILQHSRSKPFWLYFSYFLYTLFFLSYLKYLHHLECWRNILNRLPCQASGSFNIHSKCKKKWPPPVLHTGSGQAKQTLLKLMFQSPLNIISHGV